MSDNGAGGDTAQTKTTTKTKKVAAAGEKSKPNVAVVNKPASRQPASHPPFSSLVLEAVTNLKNNKGSSLAAIKKYIVDTYEIDLVKNAHYIRKAIVNAVANENLTQVKGTGAAGTFKLSPKEKQATKSSTSAKRTASKTKAASKSTESKPKAKSKKTAKPKIKIPKTMKKKPASSPALKQKPAPKRAAAKK